MVDEISHLAFVTANDIIDVLSLREPCVTISCIVQCHPLMTGHPEHSGTEGSSRSTKPLL